MFRFTLGIPGFNDALLPRLVGVLGAALLVANHLTGQGSATAAQAGPCWSLIAAHARSGSFTTDLCLLDLSWQPEAGSRSAAVRLQTTATYQVMQSVQVRTECLGAALSALCIATPSIGARLQAAQPGRGRTAGSADRSSGQAFQIAPDLPDNVKTVGRSLLTHTHRHTHSRQDTPMLPSCALPIW